jgi:hypothetical protein
VKEPDFFLFLFSFFFSFLFLAFRCDLRVLHDVLGTISRDSLTAWRDYGSFFSWLFLFFLSKKVPQATSGYGANGTGIVTVNTYALLAYPTNNVTVYSAGSRGHPIFWCHAYGARETDKYLRAMERLASLGHTVVHVQYPSAPIASPAGPIKRYDVLWAGFRSAVLRYPR